MEKSGSDETKINKKLERFCRHAENLRPISHVRNGINGDTANGVNAKKKKNRCKIEAVCRPIHSK